MSATIKGVGIALLIGAAIGLAINAAAFAYYISQQDEMEFSWLTG
jgi:hypothetical protein